MPEKIKNFINGNWINAVDGKTLKSINPADTSDIVGIVPHSGRKDIDMAVLAARNAYDKWRLTPAPKRGEIILKAAELLSKRKQEMGELVTREMGKVLPEGLGDAQEAIDMAYYMGSEGRRLSGETAPSELPNKDCKSVRVPIGVFALITPWNFPTAIPAWKMLPALVSGNTVVFKPSSYTPVYAAKLVEAFLKAIAKGVNSLDYTD
ncbi:MAG: aldehyde dehydrogenase family protein [Deltaproteobacteria bacterium]|nr:aldehyde dehydrogenase family protein [Deltaproteobacteria bacterium]